MASSGYIGQYPVASGQGNCNGSNGSVTSLWIEWNVVSQSITGNYSDVKAVMKCKRNDGYVNAAYNLNGVSYSLKVGSSTIASGNAKFDLRNSAIQTWGADANTIRVYHESNGTKSVTISGEFGYVIGSLTGGSVSSTVTLPTISRASSIGTLATGTIGTAFSIPITRSSTSFTHTLTYTFYGASGTIASNVATSTTWTPPLTLCSQRPNNTSGTVTIYCKTYSGTTLVGTTSKTTTLNIPTSVVPTISFTKTLVNGAVPSDWGLYVQGKSKASFSIAGTGSYSSTISSYSIKSGTTLLSTSNSYTTGFLTTVGNTVYTATVTDSRGRTATTTQTVSVVAYSEPTISSYSANRCDSSGTLLTTGTYLKIYINASYINPSSKNSLTKKVRYKAKTSATWSAYTSIASTSVVIGGNAISTDSEYEVEIQVADEITTKTVKASVSASTAPLISVSGAKRNVSVGGKSTDTNVFSCNLDAKFLNDLSVKGTRFLPYKEVGENFIENPRTELEVGSRDNFIIPIRTPTADVENLPRYGASLSWGTQDALSYLSMDYGDSRIYAGAGNGDKFNWKSEIYHTGHKPTATEVGALPINGGTLTGGLITPNNYFHEDNKYGLDMNNSDLVGVNGLYFNDACTVHSEGIRFPRSTSGKYDCLRVYNGKIYLGVDNDVAGTGGSTYNVYHTGYKNVTRTVVWSGDTTGNVTWSGDYSDVIVTGYFSDTSADARMSMYCPIKGLNQISTEAFFHQFTINDTSITRNGGTGNFHITQITGINII